MGRVRSGELEAVYEKDAREGESELPSMLENLSKQQEPDAVEQLVSEDSIDEVSDVEGSDADSAMVQPPSAIRHAAGRLAVQGFKPEIQFRFGRFELLFELQAGRSSRPVRLDEEAAAAIADVDVSRWRSLKRYDGIWSQSEGAIEIVLRGERVGPSPQYLLSRMSSAQSGGRDEDSEFGIGVTDGETGIHLRIGPGSDVTAALLSRPPGYRRRLLTARLDGVEVSTSDQADELAERIADSLSLDLRMTLGISLAPQRLESRGVLSDRRGRRPPSPFSFPKNAYPHAAVLLYQAGRDRSTAPLIRYWSLYQVLEFFFPKFSQAEAMRQLSRFLKSPTFNAHSDEQVVRVMQLATSTGRGGGNEEEQLIMTMTAVTTAQEIIEFSRNIGVDHNLQDRRSELTNKTVNLDRPEELLMQLGQRIYDIRCRIVHSKNGGSRDSGPGLLPGTHHDDLVRVELPLMEYLAEQALAASAEPLRLTARRQDSLGRED